MLSETIAAPPLRAQPRRGQAPARCCPDRDVYPVAPRTLGSLVKSVQPHEPIPTQRATSLAVSRFPPLYERVLWGNSRPIETEGTLRHRSSKSDRQGTAGPSFAR